MPSKRKCLYDARLYLILDAQVNSYRELIDILRKSVRCGVDIVQLRDKKGNARDILAFALQARKIIQDKIPLIINDRVDLALISGADGVHVGQEDISLNDARRILGHKKIIGVSCQTPAHVKRAQSQGADYVGFGSVFKTQTKPDRSAMDLNVLKKVAQSCQVPLFAIGGITYKNIGRLRELGVKRVAVCREICLAKDVSGMTRILKRGCI